MAFALDAAACLTLPAEYILVSTLDLCSIILTHIAIVSLVIAVMSIHLSKLPPVHCNAEIFAISSFLHIMQFPHFYCGNCSNHDW
ncbi:hypothetical protein E2C01_055955 [Portunus trituberculatus]|uniref:Uncharacterized protein n=1 Tax=Portunus trituberculatus TaxID=210409 RepID=A0A5B7GYC7_PORTR|nr:hypothetical protein [Portunus trituberculatus]